MSASLSYTLLTKPAIKQDARRILVPLVGLLLIATLSAPPINAQAASTLTTTQPVAAQTPEQSAGSPTIAAPSTNLDETLAAQLQPSESALSSANQKLLSQNAQLQRQVNDLQTQVNVLVYESKGQLFLYGAFTVLISLLVGIFISWLVFVRRERW